MNSFYNFWENFFVIKSWLIVLQVPWISTCISLQQIRLQLFAFPDDPVEMPIPQRELFLVSWRAEC